MERKQEVRKRYLAHCWGARYMTERNALCLPVFFISLRGLRRGDRMRGGSRWHVHLAALHVSNFSKSLWKDYPPHTLLLFVGFVLFRQGARYCFRETVLHEAAAAPSVLRTVRCRHCEGRRPTAESFL